jgi:hypothetical protein
MNDFAIKLGSAAAESFLKEALTPADVKRRVTSAWAKGRLTPNRMKNFENSMAKGMSRTFSSNPRMLDKYVEGARAAVDTRGGIVRPPPDYVGR